MAIIKKERYEPKLSYYQVEGTLLSMYNAFLGGHVVNIKEDDGTTSSLGAELVDLNNQYVRITVELIKPKKKKNKI